MATLRMRRALLAALFGAGACAQRPSAERSSPSSAPEAAGSTDTAASIYALAEARYAEGDYPRAVELMRRALLQLPETASADDMRHAVLMRLAHTQMRAWLLTEDTAFLVDAQRMLSRYEAVHAELFGRDDPRAEPTRNQLYAVLGEVELRLDEPARMAAEDGRAELQARARWGRDVATAADAVVDTHEGEALEGEMTRTIDVKSGRSSADRARARQQLRSDFSSANTGLVLTRPGGGDALHGPRSLVRVLAVRDVRGSPDDTPERRLARRLGYALVRGARPALRECYEDALTRKPVLVADSTVELSVLPNGELARVRVVEGQLVDAGGDVCLLDSLEAQRLVEPPGSEVRLRVSLQFFFQHAHYPDGHPRDVHRRQPRNGTIDPAAPLDQAPGIDTFTKEKGVRP